MWIKRFGGAMTVTADCLAGLQCLDDAIMQYKTSKSGFEIMLFDSKADDRIERVTAQRTSARRGVEEHQ